MLRVEDVGLKDCGVEGVTRNCNRKVAIVRLIIMVMMVVTAMVQAYNTIPLIQ